MPVAAESCGRCFCIDRSMRGHRAVVEVQTCSRCGPIVRSFAFALTSQCEDIVQSIDYALFHKKEGLQPRLHSRFSAIPLKTNFIIYPEKPVNSESHLHRWSDSVSAYIRSDMH